MARASIPVDLLNAGQVLASLGFLEAADLLLGSAEGGFDWSNGSASFVLSADGQENPFEAVLRFLAEARIVELTPVGYVEGGAADGDSEDGDGDSTPSSGEDGADGADDTGTDAEATATIRRSSSPEFCGCKGDRNCLPVRLEGSKGRAIVVSHWADGSSRNDFKLYSGNRSASRIVAQMLKGSRAKPKKDQVTGDLKTKGLTQLWEEYRADLIKAPFDTLTPMGGSFNFDPRGGWTAIDAGYSPNIQKDGIAASPVLEILAVIGLEHARPDEYSTRKVRYFVWGQQLPPVLARAALAGANLRIPRRRFEFELDLSGKNRVVTFAREEIDR